MRRIGLALLVAVVASGLVVAVDSPARACGCFTPPDPSVPVLQSGERIVFAVWGGQVTAHIQIQYSGAAKEFGWLLPLPSIPTLELGTDELFQQLTQQTAPTYVVKRVYPDASCNSNHSQGGAPGDQAATADAGAAPGGAGGPPSPLVVQDSIGPYDYAVLKADSKADMLGWLAANRYFVPAGTDDVVAQYIHPGAFFLALKLRSGQSSGDIQPVVVHYPSDLPMIPIVLTSATATPNMGIWVWLLGEGRAIPRNYYHVVLDDAAFDWSNSYGNYGGPGGPGGAPGGPGPGVGRAAVPAAYGITNYVDVVTRAALESPNHHAFVTEFAGASKVMKNALLPPGRFGDADALRKLTDISTYLNYLKNNGFAFTGTLVAILQKSIPVPPAILAMNVTPANFYFNFDYWRNRNPGAFTGINYQAFNPVTTTDELVLRVVKPVQDAQAMFETYPYLTRLFTTLSPVDMTRDPVFSFNPFLPDVSNQHQGTLTYRCASQQPQWGSAYDATAQTEEGWVMDYPSGVYPTPAPALPATLRLEILRDSGLAEVVLDNQTNIFQTLHQRGGGSVTPGVGSDLHPAASCDIGSGGVTTRAPLAGIALLGLAIAGLVRRRRR